MPFFGMACIFHCYADPHCHISRMALSNCGFREVCPTDGTLVFLRDPRPTDGTWLLPFFGMACIFHCYTDPPPRI
jgi:hypothetical protein